MTNQGSPAAAVVAGTLSHVSQHTTLSVQSHNGSTDDRKPRLAVVAALLLSAALVALIPSAAFAQELTPIANVPSWEVASEFNDSANPSGVWSYCEKATMVATSCPLASAYADSLYPSDLKGWGTGNGTVIGHNTNPIPFTNVSYSYPITVPAHALYMGPGSTGQYAVVRFTAPAKGSYKVSGQFYALDGTNFGPGIYWDTTDVELVKTISGTPTVVYASKIDYLNGPQWASFTSKTVVLKAGDTLDFQVGYANGNNFFDSTGLNAVIEKIK